MERAAHATGLPLFGWDDEDGVEVLVDSAWQQAGRVANAGALALGASEILGVEGSQRMANRWTSVFDQP